MTWSGTIHLEVSFDYLCRMRWPDRMFVEATTKDGTLHLTLERVNDTASNHDLQYRSGMVS